jgi:peptide/nickel transport system permease protein
MNSGMVGPMGDKPRVPGQGFDPDSNERDHGPHAPAAGSTSEPGAARASLLRRILRHSYLMLPAVLLVVAIIGLIGTPARDFNREVAPARQLPSAAHWLGTDALGRDVAVRLIRGAHHTLGLAGAVVIFGMLVGGLLGAAAALGRGGWADWLLMKSLDVLLAFPPILLGLAIQAGLGFSLVNLGLALSLAYLPQFSRMARSAALAEATSEYAMAARALGCGPGRLLLRHIMPNIAPPLLAYGAAILGQVILAAAALGFLGLGAQPPLPEWGRMLMDGRDAFLTHPHLMIAPGAANALAVFAALQLADGIQARLDGGRE